MNTITAEEAAKQLQKLLYTQRLTRSNPKKESEQIQNKESTEFCSLDIIIHKTDLKLTMDRFSDRFLRDAAFSITTHVLKKTDNRGKGWFASYPFPKEEATAKDNYIIRMKDKPNSLDFCLSLIPIPNPKHINYTNKNEHMCLQIQFYTYK